jgi:hypothetical protein
VAGASALTVATQCEVISCPPLTCDALSVDPPVACEGQQQVFELVISGGAAPVTITWDFDGDTVADASGNPVTAMLPAGLHPVMAFATDACAAGAATCELPRDVAVLSSTPPGEVSDVVAGEPPLLVSERGARISFQERPDATAYSLYADALGSWYAPGAASGSACFIAVTPDGPGRLGATPALAANSWLVVTASSSCAEGGPGRDSLGADRAAASTWPWCGPGP